MTLLSICPPSTEEIIATSKLSDVNDNKNERCANNVLDDLENFF